MIIKIRKWLLVGFGICCMLFIGILVYARWSIQTSLNRWCATALEAHPEFHDPEAALMTFIQSDSHSLKERNNAVWALGQARDSRALPVLRQYYSGGECDHSRELCQYELKKAIKLCSGETPNLLVIKMPDPEQSR